MIKKLFLILNFIILNFNFIISKQLRIAIIGAHDKIYEPCGKYAHANKRIYAKKYNYDVHLYSEILDDRPPNWSKICAVRKHLADYDWLFWLDSDAMIMNDNIKLEYLIDDKYDFITTRDCLLNINSGQFLIKNTPWSKKFLEDWYNTNNVTVDGVALDNGALLKLYKESEDVRNHTKILPLRMLSSYPICPLHYKIDGQYVEGDFILHAAGCQTFQCKIDYMKTNFEKLYPNEKI